MMVAHLMQTRQIYKYLLLKRLFIIILLFAPIFCYAASGSSLWTDCGAEGLPDMDNSGNGSSSFMEGCSMEEEKVRMYAEEVDSSEVSEIDSALQRSTAEIASYAEKTAREVLGKSFRPDVKKALWMAIVIPGGGQIYNRKYWKLPIIYGGLVGCIYALQWNGQMYSDYQKAYIDIMDDDPETKSYEKFLHLGAQITEANVEQYKTLFKNRKDKYRRWRDMSIFCMLGVYGLSIIDAYVDASLSQFDISDDLSMKVAPAYIHGSETKRFTASRDFLGSGGLGVRCQLRF